jgi:hypothetical protein
MEAKVEYKTQAMSVGVPMSTPPSGASLRDMAARVNELVRRAHGILNAPEQMVGETPRVSGTSVEEQLDLTLSDLHEGIEGLEKLCERLSQFAARF